VFLLALLFWRKLQLDLAAIRKNFLWLALSGIAIGFNWILLFESYRYTSVAVSTLCYYLAPILVILVSPLILKERLTGKKLTCVVVALAGMVCLSGVLQGGMPNGGELKGILFGLSAAVLYASVILLNKQLAGISALEKTILQLSIAAVTLLPYCLLTLEGTVLTVDVKALLLLIFVGVIHTGVAYALYFDALGAIKGQTAAILSYIDPVVAVLASVLLLREPMQSVEAIGAVLILGAAVVSEVQLPQKAKKGEEQ
jgi:RarD protein